MEFIDEFAKLQDNVPPFDFALVQQLIERELHGAAESIFERIEPKPVATASDISMVLTIRIARIRHVPVSRLLVLGANRLTY